MSAVLLSDGEECRSATRSRDKPWAECTLRSPMNDLPYLARPWRLSSPPPPGPCFPIRRADALPAAQSEPRNRQYVLNPLLHARKSSGQSVEIIRYPLLHPMSQSEPRPLPTARPLTAHLRKPADTRPSGRGVGMSMEVSRHCTPAARPSIVHAPTGRSPASPLTLLGKDSEGQAPHRGDLTRRVRQAQSEHARARERGLHGTLSSFPSSVQITAYALICGGQ